MRIINLRKKQHPNTQRTYSVCQSFDIILLWKCKEKNTHHKQSNITNVSRCRFRSRIYFLSLGFLFINFQQFLSEPSIERLIFHFNDNWPPFTKRIICFLRTFIQQTIFRYTNLIIVLLDVFNVYGSNFTSCHRHPQIKRRLV